MIWFTSDLHLGHANILRHQPGRPWETIEEMDAGIIANVNALVGACDELYVLGDFTAFGVTVEDVRRYRSRISCKRVHLVIGNHDKRIAASGQGSPFSSERDYLELKAPGAKLACFHYPIQPPSWRGGSRGWYHLHGHIHSEGPDYNEAQREAGVRRYDVGVDANNMFPVSLPEVVAFFEGVEPAFGGRAGKGA